MVMASAVVTRTYEAVATAPSSRESKTVVAIDVFLDHHLPGCCDARRAESASERQTADTNDALGGRLLGSSWRDAPYPKACTKRRRAPRSLTARPCGPEPRTTAPWVRPWGARDRPRT